MSDLLPPNATDAERALSIAVRPEIDVPISTLMNPYACPAHLLPWLAWHLSVDEWDATWPETTQRQTIAASISQHKIKGTVGAVKSALLRGLGRTVEINENTGVPYTFGIRVQLLAGESSGGAIGGELMERARGIVAKTKNARSELVDESYFTEGGEAAIYTGAAMLNGSEVEIKGEPTPLPLDGMEYRLLGSFWTVRMNLAYTGPIAKVSRDSDDAELNYFSVSELREFVGAGTWKYLGLYSQDSKVKYAKAATIPGFMLGRFDANGTPYASYDQIDFIGFKASLPESLYGAQSMICFGRGEFGSMPFASAINKDTSVQVWVSRGTSNSANFTSGSTINATTPGASMSTAEAFGGRFSTNLISIHDGDGNAQNVTAGSRAVSVNELQVAASVSNTEPGDPRIYGAAFWGADIGADAINALADSINDKLQ